jgi:hypothetical protein
MKMIPPAGSHGFVHTVHKSYQVGIAALVEVLEEDIPELQALGWACVMEANQPMKAFPDDQNAQYAEAMRRSVFPKPEHPGIRNRMAPTRGAVRKVTVEGREYSVPEGQDFVDVASRDARYIVFCWAWLDWGLVGPTAGRPIQPPKMTTYIDTDIGVMLLFDGENWRDPASGEALLEE